MPHCRICKKGQTKLLEGDLCRPCLTEQRENLSRKSEEATTNNDDDSYWKKMDELLEKKLAIQEEKIKAAVLTQVTEKLADINKRQTKLEEENKKVIIENKALLQRVCTLETRQKNMEQESHKVKNVINKQQGYIIQQDKLIRQKRLLISGLSESENVTYHEEEGKTDTEKVEIILRVLGVSMDKVVFHKRVGALDRGPENRPRYILMEFKDEETRKHVKENSRKLNGIEELKHIRIKADLTKEDRNEYSRLFKLKEDLEKDNPEKCVRYEKGKIYLEDEIVDEFKSSSKIF